MLPASRIKKSLKLKKKFSLAENKIFSLDDRFDKMSKSKTCFWGSKNLGKKWFEEIGFGSYGNKAPTFRKRYILEA